jgi:hypothetical protein
MFAHTRMLSGVVSCGCAAFRASFFITPLLRFAIRGRRVGASLNPLQEAHADRAARDIAIRSAGGKTFFGSMQRTARGGTEV